MMAIAAHKGLAAYALGASIVESGASSTRCVCVCACVCGVFRKGRAGAGRRGGWGCDDQGMSGAGAMEQVMAGRAAHLRAKMHRAGRAGRYAAVASPPASPPFRLPPCPPPPMSPC